MLWSRAGTTSIFISRCTSVQESSGIPSVCRWWMMDAYRVASCVGCLGLLPEPFFLVCLCVLISVCLFTLHLYSMDMCMWCVMDLIVCVVHSSSSLNFCAVVNDFRRRFIFVCCVWKRKNLFALIREGKYCNKKLQSICVKSRWCETAASSQKADSSRYTNWCTADISHPLQ